VDQQLRWMKEHNCLNSKMLSDCLNGWRINKKKNLTILHRQVYLCFFNSPSGVRGFNRSISTPP
jgi:hypothetical protein